ncbi:hypothetical protein M407DRAFT_32424 [Tulasnella calospora MUT 4182]|uniref:Uncharacterized protein n=1 Tax=Tulasnella calospora MUT 4182 TaxID=1051891 RepID=A0A0C3Q4R5_9AGAM|nr:hypothetical protein M407DRAFT_32424 [Tulasnella calospora MUT 4182]
MEGGTIPLSHSIPERSPASLRLPIEPGPPPQRVTLEARGDEVGNPLVVSLLVLGKGILQHGGNKLVAFFWVLSAGTPGKKISTSRDQLGGERKPSKKFVVSVAASGWHTGALVIDLGGDTAEENAGLKGKAVVKNEDGETFDGWYPPPVGRPMPGQGLAVPTSFVWRTTRPNQPPAEHDSHDPYSTFETPGFNPHPSGNASSSSSATTRYRDTGLRFKGMSTTPSANLSHTNNSSGKMSNLPETREKDLRVMGITPNMIKEALQRTGKVIDGTIVGFFLPKDNWKDNSRIRRARNHLKSDWNFVAERPPVVIKEERYDENFSNFDNGATTQFQFTNSVAITTGNDYTQTQSFDVSVNASVPLGLSGAMMGFTATQSAAEVKSRSYSRTETRGVSFAVDVPAGEGRIVSSATTQTSTDNVFRALIGVQGTVGIEVDPAWYLPNHYWWFYNIENVFPDASAKSEITRSRIDTKVDNIIRKLDNHKAGEILECHSLISPEPTLGIALLTDNVGCEVADPPELDSPALAAFTGSLAVRVDFRGTQPIAVERRALILQTLAIRVQARIQPLGCIGFIGMINWQPDWQTKEQATFRIPFDPAMINRNNLTLQFLQAANSVGWGGSHIITFA